MVKQFMGIGSANRSPSSGARLWVAGLQQVVLLSLACSANADTWLAHRYDDRHVIAFANLSSEDSAQAAAGRGEPVAPPRARLSEARLFESAEMDLSEGHWRRDAQWTVLLGRHQRVQARVVRHLRAELSCRFATGVLAAIEPDDFGVFLNSRSKYFLATSEQVEAPTSNVPRVKWVQPGDDVHGGVENVLRDMLQPALQSVLEGAEQRYAAAEATGAAWPSQWRGRDAALVAGDGVLSFDVQRLFLVPNGTSQLFVRAWWSVGGVRAFGINFWAREGSMRFDRISTAVSAAMRMAELQGHEFDSTSHGLLLNSFDRDDDGWGEVLLYQQGLGGAAVTLVEYGDEGPRPRVIREDYYCGDRADG